MKRPAAITACASLMVGALMPFMFSNDATASGATAADCTSQSSAYSLANGNVAKAQHQLKKAKKKYKKAKKHHVAKRTLHKKHHAVKRARARLVAARYSRAYFLSQLTACSTAAGASPLASTSASVTPSTSTSPSASTSPSTSTSTSTSTSASASPTSSSSAAANPLSDLLRQLQEALAGAGLPSELTDALGAIADQLDNVPAGVDPAAYQAALTQALATVQAEIAAAMADPTGMTAAGLLDDILNPLVQGLTDAGVPGLPDLLSGLQDTLDPILAGLGLGALGGGLPIPGL